jgi:hypothetical protein
MRCNTARDDMKSQQFVGVRSSYKLEKSATKKHDTSIMSKENHMSPDQNAKRVGQQYIDQMGNEAIIETTAIRNSKQKQNRAGVSVGSNLLA